MSTAQLVVTLAFVGLLGALHLVLRAARDRPPVSTAPVTVRHVGALRNPWTRLLMLAALGVLALAGVAFVASVLDEDEETGAPTTAATTTAQLPPPLPPEPPPTEALRAPPGTALAASVTTDRTGVAARARNRFGDDPTITRRGRGVYAVDVPGLSVQLRRHARIQVRPADGTTRATARKSGNRAEFVVFTRDAETERLADRGFELAVYLPKQDLEATAGGSDDEGPVLPPTK